MAGAEGFGRLSRARAQEDAPAVTGEARTWAAGAGEPGPGRAAGVGRRGRCSGASLDLREADFCLRLWFQGSLKPIAGCLGDCEVGWNSLVKVWSGIGPSRFPC